MELQSVPESYFSLSCVSNTTKTKQGNVVLTLEMFLEAENKLAMSRIRSQYSELAQLKGCGVTSKQLQDFTQGREFATFKVFNLTFEYIPV